jgi:CheY-like chemotaxis protein
MPAGGALIIETRNTTVDSAYAARIPDVSPGQYVCISVTDTGAGMPGEIIEKAFDPFFTTKPIGQGTGLGLSMIYGFARQSEGYCKIYSELGIGTTVRIYLPRLLGGREALASDKQFEHAAPVGQGEIVLVVEDEPTVRSLVVDVLKELGYQTIEASDGPSGLKLLESGMHLDLLVTDVGLPGLNGRLMTDAARLARPGLKVLFMTGYAENAAIAGGFLDPGMEMITKPFAIDDLARKIREIVDGN